MVYLDPRTNLPVVFRERGSHSLERRPSSQGSCPTCHRPWHGHGGNGGTTPAPNTADEPTFITNDYFQRLALSQPGSAHPSAPPSPRRRLAQPVAAGPRTKSRLTSPAPDRTDTPPPNAEWIGSAPAPPSAANAISEAAFAPQYFQRFFKVERELGRGGRGVVLLVKHVIDGVHLGHFACKRVPVGDDHSWLEKVLIEVQLLTQLSHQNLVSYRHVWLEDYKINAFSPNVPCAFILQQYCNGGDLHNYVCSPALNTSSAQQLKERIRRRSRGETELPPSKANEPKRLHPAEIRSFFKDITAGIQFLHLNGFIHRDLKPSNCLLHTVANETRVLVSDFGEVQYENIARKSTGATGTISYCAPEVLQRVSPHGPFGNFTFKSDIFSLGMILHFLCFADLPYAYADVLFEDKEDVDKLRAEISSWSGFDDRKKKRPDLPAETYSFLKRLLSIDVQYRPNADEVYHSVTSTSKLSDLMPELDRRRDSFSSGLVEELTPGKRIQKLETPIEGNSPSRNNSRNPSSRPLRPLFTKSSRSREHGETAQMSEDEAIEDEEAEGMDKVRGRAGSNSQNRRSSRSLRPDDVSPLDTSIVLRPRNRHASATSTPASPSHEHPPSGLASPIYERKPQLLLPPAPESRPSAFAGRIRAFLNSSVESSAMRSTILLTKLFSALHPCLGRNTGRINTLVVYPLMVVAVVEFSRTSPPKVRTSLAFVLLHCIVLIIALRQNLLCGMTATSWKWNGTNDMNELWEHHRED